MIDHTWYGWTARRKTSIELQRLGAKSAGRAGARDATP
jgi:hypothetical protein